MKEKDPLLSFFRTKYGVLHFDMRLPNGLLCVSIIASTQPQIDWCDWWIGKNYIITPLIDIEYHPNKI